MTRRRVVFVLPDLGLGGAQVVAVRLAATFQARGDEVVLATLRSPSTDHVPFPPGVERFVIESAPSGWRTVGILGKIDRVRNLRAFVRAKPPDVVVAFVDFTNLYALIATRGLHVPVIVSERVDPREHRISSGQRALRGLLYPWASGLVVQTPRVAEWARSVVSARKVHVIANPVPIPHERNRASAPPTIIAAGRLVSQKGFDLLIDALGGLDPEVVEGWRVEILGDGAERRALQDQIERLGLRTWVTLAGQVRDMGRRLSTASMFVLSSRFEGFPNALTEAMSWGVPVVAFDCPTGPRELIQDGVNGRLIAPNDVGELREAIAELIRSPDERLRSGAEARHSLGRFAPNEIADAWDRLFEEVSSRVRDRRGR
jgi:glycosyltransferase involved in cell wall biosynthesis